MDFLRPRPWRTWANLTSPSSANRARHPLTDAGDTDNARAIAVFARPSAAINNARARTTSRCGADGDRVTDSSTSRCPEDTNRAATGRLMVCIIPRNHQLIAGHTTRCSFLHRWLVGDATRCGTATARLPWPGTGGAGCADDSVSGP